MEKCKKNAFFYQDLIKVWIFQLGCLKFRLNLSLLKRFSLLVVAAPQARAGDRSLATPR